MRPVGRILQLFAASSVLALAGCASSFDMGGLQLGLTPATGQLSAQMSSCSLLGTPSSQYARAAHRSAFSFRQKVSQIQARYSATYRYDATAQQAAWKRIASGDC